MSNIPTDPIRRLRRLGVVGSAALLTAVLWATAGLVGVPAHAASAGDAPIGGATVTPDEHLHSGDLVQVSVEGFPPNTVVGAVECDQRVLTTGNTGYCNTHSLTLLLTGSSGKSVLALPFAVKSGASFSSDNGKGICDALHYCVLAFQSQGSEKPATEAIAGLWFGSNTKTALTPALTTVRVGKVVKFTAKVTGAAAEGLGAATADAPAGRVTLRSGGRTLARKSLPASGVVTFARKFARGKHRVTVRYSGDANYLPSSGHATVTVRAKARSRG